MRRLLACLLALVLLFALASTALAATHTVTNLAELCTALSSAASGDSVEITAAVPLTSNGAVPAGVTLTIQAGASLTLSSSARLNNNGVIRAAAGGMLTNVDGTLNNAGTLLSSDGLANTGVINNTGVMRLAGAVTFGRINLSAGGKLTNATAAPVPVWVNGVEQSVPVGATATAYTVTFNGNGATSGSTAAQSALAGSAIALNSNGFAKTGCVFAGWNTAANGSGTAYADRASLTLNANVTLYAQWTGDGNVAAGYNYLSVGSLNDPTKTAVLQRIVGNTAFRAPCQGLAAAASGCIPLSAGQYACVYLKGTVTDILNPGASNMRVLYNVEAYYQKYSAGAPVGAETRLANFNGQPFQVCLPVPYITNAFVQVEHDAAIHTLAISGAATANAYVAVPARNSGSFTLRYDSALGSATTNYNNTYTPYVVTASGSGTTVAAVTAPVAAIATTAVVAVPATGEEPSSLWMLLSFAAVMGISWALVKREA